MKTSFTKVTGWLPALLFQILSITSLSAAQADLDTAKLNTRIQYLIRKFSIPSAEIAVVKDDSVIYKFISHKADEGKNYLIGSCSKSFTALSVMMLAEKGEIDIDSPVKKYLSWFTTGDPGKAGSITVRHLLNHTSGIGSQYGFFDYVKGDTSTFRIKLTGHLKKVHLITAPGKEFCYSNLNYLILGLVVESVTKEKYGEYLADNVFSRLGMSGSHAGFNEDIQKKNIEPYQYFLFNLPLKSKIYQHSDHSLAYGYISSNAADLIEYLKFMLHKGITMSSDTLIGSSSFNTLTTPARGSYAMGWVQANYNNISFLGHTGLDENYSSVLAVCPDQNLGIVALCNINSLEFCSLVQTSVLDMLSSKPFFNPPSMEFFLRWLPGLLALLSLCLLLFNLRRWRKYSFKTGVLLRPLPVLRMVFGLIMSLSGIIMIKRIYNVSVFSVLDFQPDIVIGVLLILIFGTLSSFARYFGTYSKQRMVLQREG
jgi:CubicO group peptidase (beta-lactamase class C family)